MALENCNKVWEKFEKNGRTDNTAYIYEGLSTVPFTKANARYLVKNETQGQDDYWKIGTNYINGNTQNYKRFSGYGDSNYPNDEYVTVIAPGGCPQFSSSPLFDLNTPGTYYVYWSDSEITINGVNKKASDFKDNTIPKKLIILLQGAGGGGAGVDDDGIREGGGGGGAGAIGWCIVNYPGEPTKSDERNPGYVVKLTVPSGGAGGFDSKTSSDGHNGGSAEVEVFLLDLDDEKIYTVWQDYFIAGGGQGGQSSDGAGTGQGGDAGSVTWDIDNGAIYTLVNNSTGVCEWKYDHADDTGGVMNGFAGGLNLKDGKGYNTGGSLPSKSLSINNPNNVVSCLYTLNSHKKQYTYYGSDDYGGAGGASYFSNGGNAGYLDNTSTYYAPPDGTTSYNEEQWCSNHSYSMLDARCGAGGGGASNALKRRSSPFYHTDGGKGGDGRILIFY